MGGAPRAAEGAAAVHLGRAPRTGVKAGGRGRKEEGGSSGDAGLTGVIAGKEEGGSAGDVGAAGGRDAAPKGRGAGAPWERSWKEEDGGTGDVGARAGRDAVPNSEGAGAGGERKAAGGNAGAKREKARAYMPVDELPPEERAEIDRLLAGGVRGYQEIADALQEKGFYIVKEAVGRYEAGKRAEDRLLTARLDEVKRWAEENAGFDLAGAALAMAVEGFYERLRGDRAIFSDLPAEKAASGLIAAVRAVAQYEKVAGDRKKSRAAARAEVIAEIRGALAEEPELRAGIEKLIEREA